jgi:DNA-binding PadR family transcriptional regulator
MESGFWSGPGGGLWGRHERRHRHGMRRLRRGVLKFALLKLLAENGRHGYDLIRAVREKGWGAGAGSVYPILATLEAGGLIAGRDEGDRRTYEITEAGRQVLGEHAVELERLLNGEEDEEDAADQPAVALRDAAGRLMQAVSQLGPSSKSETIQRVRELLDEARKEIYQLLAQE